MQNEIKTLKEIKQYFKLTEKDWANLDRQNKQLLMSHYFNDIKK